MNQTASLFGEPPPTPAPFTAQDVLSFWIREYQNKNLQRPTITGKESSAAKRLAASNTQEEVQIAIRAYLSSGHNAWSLAKMNYDLAHWLNLGRTKWPTKAPAKQPITANEEVSFDF